MYSHFPYFLYIATMLCCSEDKEFIDEEDKEFIDEDVF
jgi:hypothetical protein